MTDHTKVSWRCKCGVAFDGSIPEAVRERILARWREAHSGPGHQQLSEGDEPTPSFSELLTRVLTRDMNDSDSAHDLAAGVALPEPTKQ